jgi:hypothetical protein
VALAYSVGSRCRNRAEFFQGREAIERLALVSIQALHEVVVISDAPFGLLNAIGGFGKQLLEVSTPALGLCLLFCRRSGVSHHFCSRANSSVAR